MDLWVTFSILLLSLLSVWAFLNVHGPSANFHIYGGKNVWANRQMAIVLQISVYQRTFKSRGVGQLLWNVLLSQNRWICYGSDYFSAELHCILVASHAVCGTLKKCLQVKACIGISHFLICMRFCIYAVSCKEILKKRGCLWLFCHSYMLYNCPKFCSMYYIISK